MDIDGETEHLTHVDVGGNVSRGPQVTELSGCPFLGLRDDLSSHALYPREDHVCGADIERGITLDWQQRYCLRPEYRDCPFVRALQPHRILQPVLIASRPKSTRRSATILMSVILMIWLSASVPVTAMMLSHFAINPATASTTALVVPRCFTNSSLTSTG